jgi:hypothetical protein
MAKVGGTRKCHVPMRQQTSINFMSSLLLCFSIYQDAG